MKENIRKSVIVCLLIHLIGGVLSIMWAFLAYRHTGTDSIVLGLETTLNWWLYIGCYLGSTAFLLKQPKQRRYLVFAVLWLCLIEGFAGPFVTLAYAGNYAYLVYRKK